LAQDASEGDDVGEVPQADGVSCPSMPVMPREQCFFPSSISGQYQEIAQTLT
jgi:hypothetical protein